MGKKDMNGLHRIMDANLNRAAEGLRVCEDVFRYVFDQKALTKTYKTVRHQLADIARDLKTWDLIEARDIEQDVGRPSIPQEMNRQGVEDILYANAQRVKESLRVLEETAKVLDVSAAQKIKEIRYRFYALEKKGTLWLNRRG